MRGADRQTGTMFSSVCPEPLVPIEHPLACHPPLVNAALDRLSGEFVARQASSTKIYSSVGRNSIPPEKLLHALLLQAFFGIRSERQLMEQLTYNMIFRWVVDLSMDAPV